MTSYARRIRRRWDKNQSEIIKKLKALGFSVYSTADVGGGFPDIIIGKNGITRLVEIKSLSDGKNPKPRAMRESQKRFRLIWSGSPVIVATSAEEIIREFEQSATSCVPASIVSSDTSL